MSEITENKKTIDIQKTWLFYISMGYAVATLRRSFKISEVGLAENPPTYPESDKEGDEFSQTGSALRPFNEVKIH